MHYIYIGLSIVPGGIILQRDVDGRETGEAFVELASKSDVDKALARDRKEIQHRYMFMLYILCMLNCANRYLFLFRFVCNTCLCHVVVACTHTVVCVVYNCEHLIVKYNVTDYTIFLHGNLLIC